MILSVIPSSLVLIDAAALIHKQTRGIIPNRLLEKDQINRFKSLSGIYSCSSANKSQASATSGCSNTIAACGSEKSKELDMVFADDEQTALITIVCCRADTQRLHSKVMSQNVFSHKANRFGTPQRIKRTNQGKSSAPLSRSTRHILWGSLEPLRVKHGESPLAVSRSPQPLSSGHLPVLNSYT